MARDCRARRISRVEPGHGVVVRGGAGDLPAGAPRGLARAPAYCPWSCGVDCGGCARLSICGLVRGRMGIPRRHRLRIDRLGALPLALRTSSSGVRFGMQVGLAGLFVWSFLMATGHGAGVMVWPALMPLCLPSRASAASASGALAAGLAGVSVHTLAMLSVTAAIAVTVYEWVGLEVLRRAWLNIDAVWVAALATTGMLMLLDGF